MKTIFTLLMALPLAASVWGAETPPCKLTFLNQTEFDKWLPVDANNEAATTSSNSKAANRPPTMFRIEAKLPTTG